VSGTDGNNGKWSVKVGPSYPDIVWDFFNRHSRDGSQPEGHPVITLTGDNPMSVAINTTFTDPGANAGDPEDGAIAVSSDCSTVDPAAVGSYNCIYTATDSDGNTTTATRVVQVFDPDAPVETCQEISTSPGGHIIAGRAYAGGTFSLRAFANGDNADIGASFNFWGRVTLYEGEPGKWYSQQPSACSASGGDT
jgi:hypothetical protein